MGRYQSLRHRCDLVRAALRHPGQRPPEEISMIRWGLIGCGDVAEHKSGPGFQKAAGSALVAVMRRDAARAADFAARHGVSRWYSDARDLVNDPEVDAVS